MTEPLPDQSGTIRTYACGAHASSRGGSGVACPRCQPKVAGGAEFQCAMGLLQEALRGIDATKNADAHSCVTQALALLRGAGSVTSDETQRGMEGS